MAEALDPDTFENVKQLKKAVLLYHAERAYPSVSMLNRFNSLELDNLFTVDFEAFPELAVQYPEVRGLPIMLMLYEGKVVAFKVGLISALDAYKWINEY